MTQSNLDQYKDELIEKLFGYNYLFFDESYKEEFI
jgi:hypothetical protein